MKLRLAFCSIILIFNIKLLGQHFTDMAVQVGIDVLTNNAHWGNGVSFYDFDKDGWDDYTVGLTGEPLRIFRNVGGTFEELPIVFPNAHEIKMVLWVDYDNDGDMDLFFTRYFGAWSLYRNNGDFTFTEVSEEAGLWTGAVTTGWPDSVTQTNKTYGACWGDYDNDGWLDLYICNYQHLDTQTNLMFRNNGDGTFENVTIPTGTGDAVRTSFQASFMDFDRDGWPDLHVINDRIFHKNSLYRNNGDGTFEDISAASGIDIAICAMSSTIGDYDNDGHLDIYVTNGPQGNRLMKNQGNGTFVESASGAGVSVNANSWGAAWLDYNLDGWLDLFVPTANPQWTPIQDYFYSNNGNGTFTYEFLSGFQGTNNSAYCAAVGDYNNDGLPDLAVSQDHPFKTSLWRNNLNPGNFVKVSAEGVISNKDGIGTWIDVHTGPIHQVHYTACGTGFLGQDSQRRIFGLDEYAEADSIIVTFQSGVIDKFYHVSSGTVLHVIEGMTSIPVLSLNPGTQVLCDGEEITISTTSNYDVYTWSNGSNDSLIVVNQPGQYWLEIVTPFGQSLTSDTLTISFQGLGDYELNTFNNQCFGESLGMIEVFFAQPDSTFIYTLDGVEFFETIGDLPPGEYELTFSNGTCSIDTTVIISEPGPIAVVFENTDVQCHGEANGAILLTETSGGSGILSFELFPPLPHEALTAGDYILTVTDENLCSAEYEFVISEPIGLSISHTIIECTEGEDDGQVEIFVSGGTPPYSYQWSNGETTSALENMAAGNYSVVVTDDHGCQISETILLTVGLTEFQNDCSAIIIGKEIQLNCLSGTIGVFVYDVTGRLVEHTLAGGNHHRIKVAETGIYFVDVKTQGGIISRHKIFVQ